MNIRPAHASACKGDLLIHVYCETRITLSQELNSKVFDLLNYFDSTGALDLANLEYQTVIENLSISEELKSNFMKFFESIDIEKNGIVTKSDIITFLEVKKAVN